MDRTTFLGIDFTPRELLYAEIEDKNTRLVKIASESVKKDATISTLQNNVRRLNDEVAYIRAQVDTLEATLKDVRADNKRLTEQALSDQDLIDRQSEKLAYADKALKYYDDMRERVKRSRERKKQEKKATAKA
jgi:septal ring factor EnvC (AmiA/AmiB activator)